MASKKQTLRDLTDEVRAIRQRAVLLAQLRTQLESTYGVAADEPELIETAPDNWEAPIPQVVAALSLELGVAVKEARQRCAELEGMPSPSATRCRATSRSR